MTRKRWKGIKKGNRPQFVSYKEWKEYVCNKYDGYTVEKLEEFYRYLNIRQCSSKGMGEYLKLLTSNSLTFMITYCLTGIIDEILGKTFYKESTLTMMAIEIVAKLLVVGFIVAVLLWFIVKMMSDYARETIHQQFYSDYQEIIKEMIAYKKSLTIS